MFHLIIVVIALFLSRIMLTLSKEYTAGAYDKCELKNLDDFTKKMVKVLDVLIGMGVVFIISGFLNF